MAITVEAFTARRACEIADELRARHGPVVIGGIHATALLDEAAEHADAIYTGDAETRWAEVVADAHEGHLKPRYDAAVGPPQPGTQARRDIYEGKGCLPVSLLQFGRGCHFRCECCAAGAYFEHRHQLAAGLTAIVIALVTVPRYVNARRDGPVRSPDRSLGRWGGRGMLALALMATVLMAIGALLDA